MADLDVVLRRLRALHRPVPIPQRLPSPAEVDAMASQLGLALHPDYRRYLLEASDVNFGTHEPATITTPHSHTHLPELVRDARELGLDPSWAPICCDNGDYFCQKPGGEIVFWSHGAETGERWPGLAAWIEDVWIGESD